MAFKLILFTLLLVLTAFFVATEFAIVRLRASRVGQMVEENVKNAKAVEKVTGNLDGYLSACQLGITITALGLGWLGEPTVEQLLHPLFDRFGIVGDWSSWLSFIISFVLVTYLHVVFGELAPKTVAIVQAEKVSQVTAPLIIAFYKLLYPFIWVLNGSAGKLVKLMGLRSAAEHEAHSEEEIRMILSESYESGKINKHEYGYVNRIFAFDERLAREIMVPRTDMACLYTDHTREQNIAIMKREQYTRFPVAKGDKDHIVGILNTKTFFLHGKGEATDLELSELLQPALSVPDVTPLNRLLQLMQLERVHLVILIDEYGGTSGLLTIEDILEEIVGEIRDEFDGDELRDMERLGPQHYLVDGKLLIPELNEATGLHLPSEERETIGGWLYMKQPDLPQGQSWHYDGVKFVVKDRDEHRIRRIEIFTDLPEEEWNAYGHA